MFSSPLNCWRQTDAGSSSDPHCPWQWTGCRRRRWGTMCTLLGRLCAVKSRLFYFSKIRRGRKRESSIPPATRQLVSYWIFVPFKNWASCSNGNQSRALVHWRMLRRAARDRAARREDGHDDDGEYWRARRALQLCRLVLQLTLTTAVTALALLMISFF